ncbi:uncharacterized protein FIBRA_02341 [Fibroporia radiculosa]|uniref:DUF6533 domain-containing protein n=1 Tax=Fibroporia radiculosa TaxID=599839 RepID=J4I903_9APHY|nr:uncharacterized protein FIBRA_02341 [Fibroporia radiculosa]CCM00311.1 predicted protein [Fibroporia radiculosa]
MSSSSDPDSMQKVIISLLRANYISNYCELAVASIIFYDYAITLGQEIQLIWGRKPTSAIIIFFLNRYVVFAFGIVAILGTFAWSTDAGCACAAVIYLYDITSLALYGIIPLFSSLRVYAVSDGNWLLAMLTLMLGLVPLATNMFSAIRTSRPFVEFVGDLPVCTFTQFYSNSTHYKRVRVCGNLDIEFTVATRTCAIASDAIVLLVTWWKTYSIKKDADRAHLKSSVATLLLRDGTIYFLALLTLNIIQMLTAVVFMHSNVVYVSIFLIPLPAVLTSRFLLDLRQVHDAGSPAPASESSASLEEYPDFTLTSGIHTTAGAGERAHVDIATAAGSSQPAALLTYGRMNAFMDMGAPVYGGTFITATIAASTGSDQSADNVVESSREDVEDKSN